MLSALSNFVKGVSENIFHSDLQTLQEAWAAIQEEHKVLLDAKEGLDDPALLERSYLHEHLRTVISALVSEEKSQKQQHQRTPSRQYQPQQQHQQHGHQRGMSASLSSPMMQTEGPCFEFVIREEIIEHLCTLGLPDRPPGMRGLMTQALDEFFRQVHKPLLTHSNVHRAVRNFITVCVDRQDLATKQSRSRLVRLLKTLCLRLRDNPSLWFVFFEESRQATDEPEFLIFTTLLCLLNDDDADANVAIQGLLCCVQLPEPRIAQYIVDRTDFSAQLVSGLSKHFHDLPTTIDITAADAGGGDMFDDVIPQREQRVFHPFMLRMALIDVVVQSTLPPLANQLCEMMHQFLNADMRSHLVHVKESVSKWAMVYMRTILERVESVRLRRTICAFLLNTTEEWSPRRTLVKRTDSLNEDIMVTTLGLFETLVSFHDEWIINNLVLNDLRRMAAVVTTKNQEEVEEVEDFAARPAVPLPPSVAAGGGDRFQPVASEEIFAMFPHIQHRILNDPHYDDYRLDAQDSVQTWFQSYEGWSKQSRTPPSPSASASSSSSSESLLLSSLFHKLELFYENSFRSNLRLTSVLAQLAYCPDPLLHSFMLNPHHAQSPQQPVRPLMPVLAELWRKGLQLAEEMPDFANRLQEVRSRLNGASATRSESQDEERNLQALVVLEEFIKELVAISEAKTRLQQVNDTCRTMQTIPVPGVEGEIPGLDFDDDDDE